MSRPDLLELVAAARQVGLPVALAPSVTPRLKTGPLEELRGLGVSSVSLSLDGATAATHEGIRGVHGHFAETIAALHRLRSLGFKVQVNTAVMRANVDELAGVAAIVKDVGATSWEVFFLVKVGRGRDEQELGATDNEDVAHLLFEASHYGFAVRTVEGPWCRRVAAWRKGTVISGAATAFGLGAVYQRQSRLLQELLGPPAGPPQMASAGTRDGKGIFFVAHDGWAYPAGFLPLRLGNVRHQSPVAIYRRHPLLRAVRAAEFGGRCGRCEFKDGCGGSRARAFASSGDPLGEDPACAYVPA
jgi:MoaA/NifB/PqqE/SkfB family radical SAM enzyme